MNPEAFDNLKRVLRTVPDDQLRMDKWSHCAIGHTPATMGGFRRAAGLIPASEAGVRD
jgi:hypothetical protein